MGETCQSQLAGYSRVHDSTWNHGSQVPALCHAGSTVRRPRFNHETRKMGEKGSPLNSNSQQTFFQLGRSSNWCRSVLVISRHRWLPFPHWLCEDHPSNWRRGPPLAKILKTIGDTPTNILQETTTKMEEYNNGVMAAQNLTHTGPKPTSTVKPVSSMFCFSVKLCVTMCLEKRNRSEENRDFIQSEP